jgi:predicted transposase/invertase (TIGR01784 family)
MAKYLDPKADLTFKKVFGEHPDLLRSFLNALLPFKDGEFIETVEYLPPELVPDNPLRKNSIVDVHCTDNYKRQFIVEMQTVWSNEFQQRVLFNASKAYVKQLGEGNNYELLKPVFSLNLVNDVFEKDIEDWYHYYRLVHEKYSDKVINGLQLLFVELPKFKPQTFRDKKMMVLWLRFLTEINEKTDDPAPELKEDALIKKALNLVEHSAYTDKELADYDKFWDIVRTENTLIASSEKKGERNKALEIARNLKQYGMSVAEISQMTGLSEDEINKL